MKTEKVSFEVESGRYDGKTMCLIKLKDAKLLITTEEALKMSEMIRISAERTQHMELLLEYLTSEGGVELREDKAMFLVMGFCDWLNKKQEEEEHAH